MSRIRGRGTAIELLVEKRLRKRGIRFESHVADLPGRPDIVLRRQKMAVFVDGDFWHGWRFPQWAGKLSPKWREKIAENIRRDRRNHRRLRAQGWVVLRLWEHQIERDLDGAVDLITSRIQTLAQS